jgi:protein TonB
MELSILLHLVVLFIVLPRAREVWPSSPATSPLFAAAEPVPESPPPLEFELVDLPDQREEKPSSERAALSDLDRRAHGGEGEQPADRPATRGTTFQLVEAEGGEILDRGAPPREVGPPSRTVPLPEPEPERPEPMPEEPAPESEPEGAGQAEPERGQSPPTLRLPPPGSWTLPPANGGLEERPDRDGGKVDEGGLSFDTQWYDWGPYAAKMLRKIRRNWRIPEIARLGVGGVVRIRFFIERDGTVTGVRITDESGKPPMDFAARDAIGDSSPFDPLPSDLTGVEREGVTITFYYNTRPPDR